MVQISKKNVNSSPLDSLSSRKTSVQRLSEAELDSLSSRKTQAKRLSEAIDKFDTVVEHDSHRLMEYQAQPASPHPNPPIFPGLPPAAQLQWTLLLLVHLIVLWTINRKK